LYKECGAGAVKHAIAFCLGCYVGPLDPLQFCGSRLRFRSGLERIDVLAENFDLSKAIGLRFAEQKRGERHSENNGLHRSSPFRRGLLSGCIKWLRLFRGSSTQLIVTHS
jgi:hypothetical protein